MSKLLLLLLFFAPFTYVPAQETAEEKTAIEDFEKIKFDQLKRVRTSLVTVRDKINKTKERLKEGPDLVSKIKLENKLNGLEKEYEEQSFDFIELATNINLRNEEKTNKKTDFSQDLKEILGPAIESIKEISLKPRQIQDLNEKINSFETRYNDSLKAIEALEKIYKEGKHKELKWTLKRSIQRAKKLSADLKIELDENQFRLLKMEKNKESIVTTFSVLIFNFFKTKGKNLFLAIFVFLLVYWPMTIGRPRLISFLLNRIHRSKNAEQYVWVTRPVKVLYSVFSFFLSLFFGILTLYVLNDWVLVTFIIFAIAAIIWSSKHYLPVFFEQSKIVLNLGSVREGERVIFNELPWKVKNLGYYCRLENPSLSGGTIRISSKELVNLYSRPINVTEPWFPTKTNDWVDVDGVYGKVVVQSPEQVVIKKISSEHKYFKTVDFYQSKPINLSEGFAINFVFGVDYSHQKILFDKVIPAIRSGIKESFESVFQHQKEHFKEFAVDFANANASSLDLRIFIRCDGALAPKRDWLFRNFQSVCVEICNKHGFSIPFNQLTVHMENE